MLTTRGRVALLLAVCFYVLAWGFGTREVYPVALGLGIAVLVAAVAVRLATGPFRLLRRVGGGEAVEGTDLAVVLEVRAERGVLPTGARIVERLEGRDDVVVPLVRDGDALRGRYVLHGLPRGRYKLDASRLVVEDPFGLERLDVELESTSSLVVYPRVVELERLFADSGAVGGDGRRFLLTRTSGYDLHGVRDYVQGESLRGVHWKSTARRRKLMVKELEDAPREEAAVLLDAQAGVDVGQAPDSSFEMQVRAAASVLRRLAVAGQRTALVVHGARPTRLPVASVEGDWRAALDLLAGVRPDARTPVTAALEDGRSTLDAQRLLLVTADLTPRLGDRLATLAVRRELAVIWVDSRSWGARRVEPGAPDGVAVTLSRVGIPVARVRRGDDLRAALDAPTPATVREPVAL